MVTTVAALMIFNLTISNVGSDICPVIGQEWQDSFEREFKIKTELTYTYETQWKKCEITLTKETEDLFYEGTK